MRVFAVVQGVFKIAFQNAIFKTLSRLPSCLVFIINSRYQTVLIHRSPRNASCSQICSILQLRRNRSGTWQSFKFSSGILCITNPTFFQEIRDDVIEECNKHGGVLHIYVDPRSPQGYVYVKCPSISAAVASVNALHGRWFAGLKFKQLYPNRKSGFFEILRSHLLCLVKKFS